MIGFEFVQSPPTRYRRHPKWTVFARTQKHASVKVAVIYRMDIGYMVHAKGSVADPQHFLTWADACAAARGMYRPPFSPTPGAPRLQQQ